MYLTFQLFLPPEKKKEISDTLYYTYILLGVTGTFLVFMLLISKRLRFYVRNSDS